MTNSIYLRGPRVKVTCNDYDEKHETNTVRINGVVMTIDKFRLLKGKKKRLAGMRIFRKEADNK